RWVTFVPFASWSRIEYASFAPTNPSRTGLSARATAEGSRSAASETQTTTRRKAIFRGPPSWTVDILPYGPARDADFGCSAARAGEPTERQARTEQDRGREHSRPEREAGERQGRLLHRRVERTRPVASGALRRYGARGAVIRIVRLRGRRRRSVRGDRNDRRP